KLEASIECALQLALGDNDIDVQAKRNGSTGEKLRRIVGDLTVGAARDMIGKVESFAQGGDSFRAEAAESGRVVSESEIGAHVLDSHDRDAERPEDGEFLIDRHLGLEQRHVPEEQIDVFAHEELEYGRGILKEWEAGFAAITGGGAA